MNSALQLLVTPPARPVVAIFLKRLDGTMAVRYQERYLPFELCEQAWRTNQSSQSSNRGSPIARQASLEAIGTRT